MLTSVSYGSAGNAITASVNGYANSGSTATTTLTGGFDGAIQLGIPNIVLTTVPPFGDDVSWSSAKETERTTYNIAVAAYATAHSGDGVVLADVDAVIRDAGDHTKVDPAYLSSNNFDPNDAGQAVLFTLIDPLLP